MLLQGQGQPRQRAGVEQLDVHKNTAFLYPNKCRLALLNFLKFNLPCCCELAVQSQLKAQGLSLQEQTGRGQALGQERGPFPEHKFSLPALGGSAQRQQALGLTLAVQALYERKQVNTHVQLVKMDLQSSIRQVLSRNQSLYRLKNLRLTALGKQAQLPQRPFRSESHNSLSSSILASSQLTKGNYELQKVFPIEQQSPPQYFNSIKRLLARSAQRVKEKLSFYLGLAQARDIFVRTQENANKTQQMLFGAQAVLVEVLELYSAWLQSAQNQNKGLKQALGNQSAKLAQLREESEGQIERMRKRLEQVREPRSSESQEMTEMSMEVHRLRIQLKQKQTVVTLLSRELAVLMGGLENSEPFLALKKELAGAREELEEKRFACLGLKDRLAVLSNEQQELRGLLGKEKELREGCLRLLADQRQARSRLQEYRERFLMQREEFYQLQGECHRRTMLQALQLKEIKLLKRRVEQQDAIIGRGFEVKTDQNELMVQFLRTVEQEASKGLRRTLAFYEVENNYEHLAQGEALLLRMVNIQEANSKLAELSNCRVYRPSFLAFLAQEQLTAELKEVSSRKLTPLVFLQARLLLDARYRDMVSAPSWRCLSNFADFAFGFFQNYEVDREQRRIVRAEVERKDSARLNFLLDLVHPKLDEVWEVRTLREFIFEMATNEEIYFYLLVRKRIFSGAAYLNYCSLASPCVLVGLDFALQLVGELLCKHEPRFLERVREAIRGKRRQSNGKSMVDGHFVLRVLYELFRLERLNRYLFTAEWLRQISVVTVSHSHVPFSPFKAKMRLFYPHLSYADIADIYRECLSLGGGEMRPDVFFMLGSRGFFIGLLQIPHLRNERQGAVLLEEARAFSRLFSAGRQSLRPVIASLGVEWIDRELDKLVSLFSGQKSLAKLMQAFNGRPAYQVFSQANFILNTLAAMLHDLNDDLGDPNCSSQLLEFLTGLSGSLQKCKTLCSPALSFEHAKVSAARKLTRFFGGRRFKYYARLARKLGISSAKLP